ncbi:hypothetical protein B0T24DRAFT_497245, partial [Lasiosphaeria ovina]
AKLEVDHPDTPTSMNSLAFYLEKKSRGRHADALSLMEHCARAWQRVLGPQHLDTFSSLAAVGR